MFNSGHPASKTRRPFPILEVALVALFAIALLAAATIAQLSGLGIQAVSVGGSSVTVGISTAVDNDGSQVDFQTASFQAYGNNIPFLNGTVYSYFPSAGSISSDTLEFTVPYSKAGALLWSALSSGGKVGCRLVGTASFSTPIGEADLPLNISVLASRVSIGSGSATLRTTAEVSNDQSLAAFNNASFQAYANKIYFLNATAHNSLPGANIPPKVSTVTAEISVPYAGAGAVLGSYMLNGGTASPSANGSATFQTYISIAQYGTPEIYLPMKISPMTGGYGSLSAVLYFTAIIIAVIGFALHRRQFF